jgi:hypothetical protein
MFDLNLDVLHRGGKYFCDLLYHAQRREAGMMRAFLQHADALPSHPGAKTAVYPTALLDLTAHELDGSIADPHRSADLGRQRQHLVFRRPSARHGWFEETGRAA